MSSQERNEEKLSQEDKKVIEQISTILVLEDQITKDEQLRILELLREGE